MTGATTAANAAVDAIDNHYPWAVLVSYCCRHRARYHACYFRGHISLMCPQLRGRIKRRCPRGRRKIRCDRNDEYTLRWLTDGSLQKLTQSRRETSSSSTGDDVDNSVSVEMGSLGPTNAYGTTNCRSSDASVRSEKGGVQTVLFYPSFSR